MDESDEHPPQPLREIIRLLHANARSLHDLHAKVDIIMTAQETLDALATDLANHTAQLTAATAAIKAEVDTLSKQGVDVTAISAAVAALDPVADGVAAIAPAAPAPAPAPAPVPTP